MESAEILFFYESEDALAKKAEGFLCQFLRNLCSSSCLAGKQINQVCDFGLSEVSDQDYL